MILIGLFTVLFTGMTLLRQFIHIKMIIMMILIILIAILHVPAMMLAGPIMILAKKLFVRPNMMHIKLKLAIVNYL